MTLHRQQYPEQYTHPLVGKRVQVKDQGEGVVERVVNSRFGQLALIPQVSENTWWLVRDCAVIGPVV